jgi:Iron/manganese superoxide dismutases, alpha-hairpin domain
LIARAVDRQPEAQQAIMSNFALPALPYDYSALSPYIDEQTMTV